MHKANKPMDYENQATSEIIGILFESNKNCTDIDKINNFKNLNYSHSTKNRKLKPVKQVSTTKTNFIHRPYFNKNSKVVRMPLLDSLRKSDMGSINTNIESV